MDVPQSPGFGSRRGHDPKPSDRGVSQGGATATTRHQHSIGTTPCSIDIVVHTLAEVMTDNSVRDAFRALAAFRRREILCVLRTTELPVGAIAARFPKVSRPSISSHLQILKDAGLVEQRREGTRSIYRLRPEGLDEIRSFLDQFGAVIDAD